MPTEQEIFERIKAILDQWRHDSPDRVARVEAEREAERPIVEAGERKLAELCPNSIFVGASNL